MDPNSAQRSSGTEYQGRKKTLKKKASELSSLCDVKVCFLCFDSRGRFDSYPEDRQEVTEILLKYKEKKQKEGRTQYKKKKNQERGGKERYPTWDPALDELTEDSLRIFNEQLACKLRNVDNALAMAEERARKRKKIDDSPKGVSVDERIHDSVPVSVVYFQSETQETLPLFV